MNEQNPFLEPEIDLREYFRVLYARKWIIISLTTIFCTLSLIQSFMVKPVYRATTKVLVKREAPRITKMEDAVASSARWTSSAKFYQTQYKMLQSRSLAEEVFSELGNYVPWNEWTGRRKKEEGKPLTGEDGARALLGRVDIVPIPNTEIVEINAEDIDPKLAARISNLWAESYIFCILDTKFKTTQYASGWLQEKITEAKKKLEGSELKLQEYRKMNRIIGSSVDNETSMLARLLKKKADLEISLSESLEYYKVKHPQIIGIKSELESVERKIESEKEKELETKEKEVQYTILERDTQTNREIYNLLLKRIRETEVTGGLKTTNIRIIDKATVPKKPVRPKKKLNFLIALFIGFIGGTGLAFLFETLDQSIKTPEDVKKYVTLPVLSSIAISATDDDQDIEPEFVTHKKPRSTISESYRSLRTSVMFTAVEHKRKTLVFTSPGPQEGKTTNAVNTAVIMAQAGEKTILVDCDLRNPRIGKIFNIKTDHGVTEALAGNETMEAVIRKTDIQNLDVIICGAIPPNPSELLGSKKMDGLLKELEKRYDRIIIDSPPVLAVTDAVVLSGKADGTIIVVKTGDTHRKAAIHTKEILESVGSSSLIGVVLNMVETHKRGGSYYYYYYGKYGKYGKYGYGNERKKRGKNVEEKEMEAQEA